MKREEAVGILLKSLSHTQYIHIKGVMDDPVEMWKKLKTAHRSQVANNHFHAIQKLLNIQKEDAESLTDYITWINTTTNDLKALAPSALTVQNIIDKIGVHVAIAGLNQIKYSTFTSSLLLIGMLDCTTVSTAFQNEDMKRQANLVSSGTALTIARGKKTTIQTCMACKKRGHPADQCWIVHPELRPAQLRHDGKSAN